MNDKTDRIEVYADTGHYLNVCILDKKDNAIPLAKIPETIKKHYGHWENEGDNIGVVLYFKDEDGDIKHIRELFKKKHE